MTGLNVAIATVTGFSSGVVGSYAMTQYVLRKIARELETKYPPTTCGECGSNALQSSADARHDLHAQDTFGIDAAARSVICGFDPVIIGDLTPGAWGKVLAARRLLGRPLDHNEVLEIVEAEDSADAHS